MSKDLKAEQLSSKLPGGLFAQQVLLNKIENGEFNSGQALKESVIAKETGLSRQAVREALNQMVGWGLVQYTPYCGYKIKEFTIYDVLEWQELREAIEPIAARKLAESPSLSVIERLEECLEKEKEAFETNDRDKASYCDLMFHSTVITSCGNKRFAQMQNVSYLAATLYLNEHKFDRKNMDLQGRVLSRPIEEHSEEELKNLTKSLTLEWHGKMLDAIKNRNPEEAEELFRTHARIQVGYAQKAIEEQQKRERSNSPDIMAGDFTMKMTEKLFV